MVATNKGNRWFFLFGFEKNDRANISAEEKEALQCIAQDLLARTVKDLNAQVEDGTLPPLATSNSPTFGRANSPGQDGLIISHHCLRAQGVQPLP